MEEPKVTRSKAIAFLVVAVPLWIGVGAVAGFVEGALAVLCWYLLFGLFLTLAKLWRQINADK